MTRTQEKNKRETNGFQWRFMFGICSQRFHEKSDFSQFKKLNDLLAVCDRQEMFFFPSTHWMLKFTIHQKQQTRHKIILLNFFVVYG